MPCIADSAMPGDALCPFFLLSCKILDILCDGVLKDTSDFGSSDSLPDNPAPFKDNEPDVELSKEVLEMLVTASLFHVVLPVATFAFVA